MSKVAFALLRYSSSLFRSRERCSPWGRRASLWRVRLARIADEVFGGKYSAQLTVSVTQIRGSFIPMLKSDHALSVNCPTAYLKEERRRRDFQRIRQDVARCRKPCLTWATSATPSCRRSSKIIPTSRPTYSNTAAYANPICGPDERQGRSIRLAARKAPAEIYRPVAGWNTVRWVRMVAENGRLDVLR